MSTVDLDELQNAVEPQRRALLMNRRPAMPDIRVIWWADLVDQLKQRALDAESSLGEGTGSVELAVWITDFGAELGDLSAVDAAVVLAGLAESLAAARPSLQVSPLRPENVAWRCIAAIRLRPGEVPATLARERAYLLEEESAWVGPITRNPSDSSAVNDDLNNLDDLRRLLPHLRVLASRVGDERLLATIQAWLTVDDTLHHGADVSRRGREFLPDSKG